MRAVARMRLTRSLDALLAVAAVLTIVAPHWPWYVATQTPPGGNLMAPEGTAAGLPAHPALWAVTGLAVVQLVLLLARHARGGRLRVPGDRAWLFWVSVLVCFLVAADADYLPDSWYSALNIAGESGPLVWPRWYLWIPDAKITLTWSYGAAVAVAAALTSLAAAFVSPGPPGKPVNESPGQHLSPASGDGLRATAAELRTHRSRASHGGQRRLCCPGRCPGRRGGSPGRRSRPGRDGNQTWCRPRPPGRRATAG
jgi:hypothetical protein